MINIETWKKGEYKAEKFLVDNGYKILDKNCKIAGIEIDIIVKESKKLKKLYLINDFKTKYKKGKSYNKEDFKFDKKILKNNLKQVKDAIVFVEVKARSSKKYGESYEAVDKLKMNHIMRGANAYIQKNKLYNIDYRIDVISIVDDDIVHIKNAQI